MAGWGGGDAFLSNCARRGTGYKKKDQKGSYSTAKCNNKPTPKPKKRCEASDFMQAGKVRSDVDLFFYYLKIYIYRDCCVIGRIEINPEYVRGSGLFSGNLLIFMFNFCVFTPRVATRIRSRSWNIAQIFLVRCQGMMIVLAMITVIVVVIVVVIVLAMISSKYFWW